MTTNLSKSQSGSTIFELETDINKVVGLLYEKGYRVVELYVNPLVIAEEVGGWLPKVTWRTWGLVINVIPDENVSVTTFEFRARREYR